MPTDDVSRRPKYTCSQCGGARVQVSMPTWVNPNNDWRPIPRDAVDIEAIPLDVWCEDCEDHHPIDNAETGGAIAAAYVA